MKKLFRRNQIVLTILAVLVAVAGYITLTGNDPSTENARVSAEESSIDELSKKVAAENAGNELAENNGELDGVPQKTDDSEAGSYTKPGEAVLTSGVTVADFIAEARLSREQVRAANKETLLTIIDSTELSEAQKQDAVSAMMQLTQTADKENATETLLHAKGFNDAYVSIVDGRVNVVIAKNAISEAEKAQIEDIVKQKTDMATDQIVISLMDIAKESEGEASE